MQIVVAACGERPAIQRADADAVYKQILKCQCLIFVGETNQACYQAHAIVVCAGGHRLKLANDLGYGDHFSVLPVVGAYCFTPQTLNGKAYRVRNDRLPVAAIPCGPGAMVSVKTRWGPKALALPVLER